MSRSPGLEKNENNIKTSAINTALFLVMINLFTLFIAGFHIGTLLRLYSWNSSWFLVVGIVYLFTLRYLVLRRYQQHFASIMQKFDARQYPRLKISLMAVLMFTCTLVLFMACSGLVLAFR